jgi:hypothetical protein
MIQIKPKYSRISRVIVVPDGYIILESYGAEVNLKPYLYKIDLAGQLVWEQCHRVPKYHQYCDLELRGDQIIAHDGTGEARLNPQTGELTDWLMTK